MNLEEFKKELDNIPWYEELYYMLYRFIHRILDIPQKIKWFFQRGKNGYAECDVWSLDRYLSSWMPKALKELRENTHGCIDEMYDKENKEDECHRWKEILLKMEKGFRAIEEMDEFLPSSSEYQELKRVHDEGMALFVKYFRSLWD